MEGGDARGGAACTSRGLVLVSGGGREGWEGCGHHAAAHPGGRRERRRGEIPILPPKQKMRNKKHTKLHDYTDEEEFRLSDEDCRKPEISAATCCAS